MTVRHDDDLRELFAPLAVADPAPAELRSLHRGATARRSRSPRRTLAGVAGVTAVLAAGLAVLPGAPSSDDPLAGGSVLRAAAAAADDQPVPRVQDAPLRYAKLRSTFSYTARDGDRMAEHHVEQLQESWVGAKWEGRTRSARGRVWNTGDAALAQAAFGFTDALAKPRDEPYAYGDGPLAELDPSTLPEGREAIVATLREGIRLDRWGPYPEARGQEHLPAGPERDAYTTYAFIGLLVNARLTPNQRAALLDVLATDPAARDLGAVTDREGRKGRGVALTYGNQRFTINFDPRTFEILEWTMSAAQELVPARHGHMRISGSPSRVETVLETGYATRIP